MTTWAEPKQLSLMADPLDVRFVEFHHSNPHVYERLVELAYEWLNAGHDYCSIDMLCHHLRFEQGIKTQGDSFKVNNSFTSRYARLISANHPSLSPLFRTRSLRSEYEEGVA